MKVPKKKVKRETRGRKGFLADAEKVNAYFPHSLVRSMRKLRKRGKRLKLPVVFTQSLIMREGSRMFIRKQQELMDKAERGVLHAKPRPKGKLTF